MRILHTSDWHLGRSFGEFSLLDQQELFIDWLVATVVVESVDLVLVAGDLFDRALPTADAVALFGDAVQRVRQAGAELVAIAGNHDSAPRIAVFDGLVADGTVIRGGFNNAAEVVTRRYGDTDLAIVAVPFLDPLLAPAELRQQLRGPDDSGGGRLRHDEVLANVLGQARESIGEGSVSVVLSHAFVTGGETSESERELTVGDAGMVAASVFDGFDYVALGHLHHPQSVGGSDTVRYSGSPLPYSFSETRAKSVTVIDVDASGVTDVVELPIAVGRTVTTLSGRFDDIMSEATPTDDWVRVVLTDPGVVIDAHRRLRDLFPHLVEVARAEIDVGSMTQLTVEQVRQRSPEQLSTDFWKAVTGETASDEVRAALHDSVAPATGAENSEAAA